MVSGEQLIFDFFRTINTNFDFENFLVGSKNLEVFSVLKSWSSGRGSKIIYLWGESSVGKTHLLHSALKMIGERSIYIPLKEVEGLEHCRHAPCRWARGRCDSCHRCRGRGW